MDQKQVYAAASIIDSVYYQFQHTNWLYRSIRNQAISQISFRLEVPLIVAKELYRYAIENHIPKVWYALVKRNEIIDFPSGDFIPESVRFICEDSIREIEVNRHRLDELISPQKAQMTDDQ